MKREAEANAAEDARQRESIEVKNQGDATVYNIEKLLRDHGDKVSAEDKQATETALNELREALKTDDLERIKKSQEAVTQASHKLAEAMYRDAQAKAQSGPTAGGSQTGSAGEDNAAKGDVVDAEFEDLGDKK